MSEGLVSGGDGTARVAKLNSLFSPLTSAGDSSGRICVLTFVRSQGERNPRDAGYRAMAATVLSASGYAQRS